MKISVFGLGYVGAVTAGCLSSRGHEIIGVDTQHKKVELFNRGEPPIVEPGLAELFQQGKVAGLLHATLHGEEAILKSDVSFICVGTPSSATGELDLTFVRGVASQIANTLRKHQKKHTVLIRSTMMPGSTEPIVDEFFADLERAGLVEIICFPEFLREGTAVEDFENPSLSVIGTRDGRKPSEHLSGLIGSTAQVLDFKAAEVVKHASNAFHATKITFANEMGRLLKSIGIDAQAIMALLCQDTKLNLSSYYMKPGNPFGGSCLPKDVRAMCQEGQKRGIALPLMESLLPSNAIHLQTLLDKIQALEKTDVALLGLSFKPDTDDLRESAMVEVAQRLWQKGYPLRIFDPALNLASIIGSNKREIDLKMPHLASLLKADLAAAVGTRGLIVVAHKCVSIKDLRPLLTPAHVILDVNGWPELRQSAAKYEGFCW